MWDKEDTKRYFIAGGGAEGEFNDLWALLGNYSRAIVEKLESRELCLPGGALFYLSSGRKRSAQENIEKAE